MATPISVNQPVTSRHPVPASSSALQKELNPKLSESTAATKPLTENPKLISWVEEMADLTQPDSIHWCDGSAEEYDRLCQEMVDGGTFERLSDAKRPNSYLCRSDP